MEGTFGAVWPVGEPSTLWNYHLLKAEDLPLLPIMGFQVETNFALAFAFGAFVIGLFAWRRFRERSFDPTSFDYRVLKELAPTELLGRNPMMRAYAYYAGTLLAIYAAMTFFGKLILETARALPIAGIQVDVSALNFSSPQWPLLLAFGLAGFVPLLKPLEVAESWLRQHAHQAVGIPVKLKQQTIRLVDNLKPQAARSQGGEDAPAKDVAPVPQWVRAHIGDTDTVERVLRIRDELELFLLWINTERRMWPGIEVRSELQRLEREEAAEAESVLQDFEDLLGQNYNKPPRSRTDKGQSPESLQAHRKRLEKHLDTITRGMERLRDELASILVVYAERDTEYDQIRDARLKRLLKATFPQDGAHSGPEFGILVALVPVFLLYAVACALGQHPLLSSVDRVPVTVLATVGLETARIAMLFWVPVVAAFALRYHLMERGARDRWIPLQLHSLSAGMVRQMLAAIVLGCLASLVGMVLLALLWAAVIAQNQARFQEILFGGAAPMVPYFVTQVGLVAVFLTFTLLAADARATATLSATVRRVAFGLLSAALVLALAVGHLYFWYHRPPAPFGPCTGAEGRFLLDMFAKPNCFSYYNALDLVIYPTMAFLAALVSGSLPESATRGKGARSRPSVASAASATAAASFAFLLLSGTAADAEVEAVEEGTLPIVVGFREDAEPFSYRIQIEGESRYIGYIADLCYSIFAGSNYRVISVTVDAKDRFARIRQTAEAPYDPESGEKPEKIDVLCDPVTLRFSDPDERATGVFSPIIFASGVSYMHRPTRTVGADAYLGYVVNSTASGVVERVCAVDLLHVRRKGTAQDCAEDIKAATDAAIDAADHGSTTVCDQSGTEATGPRYRICAMTSHSELIEWFCRAGPLPYQMAYVGDRDIIQGKLRSWLARREPCPVDQIEQQQQSFTYEPYAIVITKKFPGLIQHVQRRVYEFFSHRTEALSLFTKYFPDQQMSAPLANLFLLNAVAEPQVFIRPAMPAESSTPPIATSNSQPFVALHGDAN